MNKTKVVYDLNIYRLEEVDGTYSDPWRMNIYRLSQEGHTHQEELPPFDLTPIEASMLGLGSGDFDAEDSWYDLEWLMSHPTATLSKRLLEVFSSLPKYYEENN